MSDYPIPCFDPKAYYSAHERDRDDCRITEHFKKYELMSPSGEMYILRSTLDVIEEVRTRIKLPILVNGNGLKYRGYRTPEDQAYLRTVNANATKGVSSHEYGAALDMDVPRGYTVREFIKEIREAEHDMGLRKGRVGWKMYGGGWIHYDRVFECFEGGCNDGKNPFPSKWVSGAEW